MGLMSKPCEQITEHVSPSPLLVFVFLSEKYYLMHHLNQFNEILLLMYKIEIQICISLALTQYFPVLSTNSSIFRTPDKKFRSLHVDTEKKVLKKVLKEHKKRLVQFFTAWGK